MKVLVTGNLGYIGSVLTSKLENDGYEVCGLDIGYFKENLVSKYVEPKKQTFLIVFMMLRARVGLKKA